MTGMGRIKEESVLKSAYLHSSFSDRHNGVFFKITFYAYPKGWATDLEIEDLPLIESRDKSWPTKEEAQAETERTARETIERNKMATAQS